MLEKDINNSTMLIVQHLGKLSKSGTYQYVLRMLLDLTTRIKSVSCVIRKLNFADNESYFNIYLHSKKTYNYCLIF